MVAIEPRAHQINYTRLDPDAVVRLSEIDRSEHITLAYEFNAGVLTLVEVDWQVPNWFADRSGEHSLAEKIAFCRNHLEHGGILLGALHGDLLVGIAIVRPSLRADMAQLAFLHVSQEYRRQGIAQRLMDEACQSARSRGARRMYVSATPSESAVGFYLSMGCQLADPVDPDLYALEPEDIHLILEL